MREIPLTRGHVTFVDDADYDWLMQWKWHTAKAKKITIFYYALRSTRKNGKRAKLYMHQALLGEKEGYVPDHIDGNGLNNQRHNLRYVTRRQNAQNLHIKKTSQYPGVYWHKRDHAWRSSILVGEKKKFLGNFKTEQEAYASYCQAVEMLGDHVLGASLY